MMWLPDQEKNLFGHNTRVCRTGGEKDSYSTALNAYRHALKKNFVLVDQSP